MTTTTLPARLSDRRTLSPLTRWTAATLIAGTLLLVYMQIFLFRSFDPPVALIFGVPALLFAALVMRVRRRWVPLLGVVYWLLFIAANAPYLAHDLSHPEFFTTFSFSLVLLLPAVAGLAAGLGATVQNYRTTSTASDDSSQRLPRWFSVAITALAAFSLGAMVVASLAPASAGVNAETLASLPALTTANTQFSQSQLRAQAGETVALRLENQDAAGHSFDIDELDLHVSIPAGEPTLALFQVSTPGTYTFYCAVPGHREAGMVGTLIVEP